MHSFLHASHCQTHQPVTADWKVPAQYKRAQVLPLLKKPGLMLHCQQTTFQSPTHRLCPRSSRDSCWHACGLICSALPTVSTSLHSKVAALLEVVHGIFMVADEKQVTLLIGLNLSVAFDTVNHRLLLDHLRLEFGVTSAVLGWLQFCLQGVAKK